MTSPLWNLKKKSRARSTSVILAASLVVSGLAFTPPAFANTASNPTVTFDGNTLAVTSPKDEVVSRLASDSLALSPTPLSRIASTNREGYTFGGWSLVRGGASSNEITTSQTSDTFRTIYAVWNTTVRYSANGADSGALTNFKTRDVYRFGQNLELPNAGTLVKSSYSFGGWMTAPYSPTRITNYIAGSADTGNPVLYAAWIKSVAFDSNGASGASPASVVYTSGGPALKLPSSTQTSLRKPGHYLAGWSTFANGPLISSPGSFIPLLAENTLYAVWKVQGAAANGEIPFRPGKSALRASQKLVLDDIASSIGAGTSIKLAVSSVRASGTTKALGKSRIAAVVEYLRSVGVQATVSRSNVVGAGGTQSSPRNNRVTIQASWTNPAN